MKYLSWKELAEKINSMSEEEQNKSVKVWGEDNPLSEEVLLENHNQDMCYDKEDFERGCDFRSNFDDECDLGVALEAGKYYLFY